MGSVHTHSRLLRSQRARAWARPHAAAPRTTPPPTQGEVGHITHKGTCTGTDPRVQPARRARQHDASQRLAPWHTAGSGGSLSRRRDLVNDALSGDEGLQFIMFHGPRPRPIQDRICDSTNHPRPSPSRHNTARSTVPPLWHRVALRVAITCRSKPPLACYARYR